MLYYARFENIIIAATRHIRFVLIGYLQCSCCPIKYILLFRMDIAADDRRETAWHNRAADAEGRGPFFSVSGQSNVRYLYTASTYICHIHIYTYMYIYIEREREMSRRRQRRRNDGKQHTSFPFECK